jgi:hypothetical protein
MVNVKSPKISGATQLRRFVFESGIFTTRGKVPFFKANFCTAATTVANDYDENILNEIITFLNGCDFLIDDIHVHRAGFLEFKHYLIEFYLSPG